MRRRFLRAGIAGVTGLALLGVAGSITFDPDARVGDRQVELRWSPEVDDPVFTGNLQLFQLGDVAVSSGEATGHLLYPGEVDEVWAVGLRGEHVQHLSYDAVSRAWFTDRQLLALPAGVEVLAAGIHPLGILIAAGLSDGRIAVWRPKTSSSPALYAGHVGACRGVAFKPLSTDLDTSFVTVGDDGFWKEWGRPGAVIDSVQAGRGSRLFSVAIERRGNSVAVGSDQGRISLWPLDFSGQAVPQVEMTGHGGRAINDLIFNEGAERLASGDDQGSVSIWETARGRLLGEYDPEIPSPIQMAYGPREGRYISYAHASGAIGLLNGYTADEYRARDELGVGIGGFVLSRDGLQGFFGTEDGRVEWWYQAECVPSLQTPECFGGYQLWRSVEPDTSALQLLRVYDYGDSTWGFRAIDTLRVFIDPDSIIRRGGDSLAAAAGPHNGIPYYYSITKYYWVFQDGGRFRVRRNTPAEGFYRTDPEAAPAGLVPRVGAVTSGALLRDVYVVPNPYIETDDLSHYGPISPATVRFFNLPARATVRIYTGAGELVRTLEHPQATAAESGGALAWDLRNQHGAGVTAGVYFYSVVAANGESTTGFFTIVR